VPLSADGAGLLRFVCPVASDAKHDASTYRPGGARGAGARSYQRRRHDEPRVRPPRRFRRGRSMLRRAPPRQPWRRRPPRPRLDLPSEQPALGAQSGRRRSRSPDTWRARRAGPERSSHDRTWRRGRRGLRAPLPTHHSEDVSEEVRIATADTMNAPFQSAISPASAAPRAVRSPTTPAANEAAAMHASHSARSTARSRWSQDLTLPLLTRPLYRRTVSRG
jgi:hypothetical protein